MNNLYETQNNYNITNTSYLSSGNLITTHSHRTEGHKKIFANISGETDLLELFKYYVLFDSEPNQKNTFTYMPSILSKKAFIIEFGVQSNKEGFGKPSRTTLCIGSEPGIPSNQKIICNDSSVTATKTSKIIPAKDVLSEMPQYIKDEIFEVLNAENFEDLSVPVQNRLLPMLGQLPEEIQAQLANNPNEILNVFKTFIKKQLENPSIPAEETSTTEGGFAWAGDFSDKPKIDELYKNSIETGASAEHYSYTRTSLIAPEEEETVISKQALETMKNDLKIQMEILGRSSEALQQNEFAQKAMELLEIS